MSEDNKAPADDVREAMLNAVSDVLADTFSDAVTERIAADVLTRLSVTHEVRPRGTVTDAEKVCDAWPRCGCISAERTCPYSPAARRAALEAARSA